MIIQELIAEEKVDAYLNRLTKSLKIKKLGSGYFSSVFQHPVYHNVSVKITRKADPVAMTWVKEAMQHLHNPWYPRIIGIHKVHFHSDEVRLADIEDDVDNLLALEGRHIVFMEKLRPIKKAELKKAAVYIAHTLPSHLFLPADFHEQLMALKLKPWHPHYVELKKKLMKGVSIKETQDTIFNLEELLVHHARLVMAHSTDDNLVELCKSLIKVGTDDLHDGNIMMREEGGALHPVITDPVASRTS